MATAVESYGTQQIANTPETHQTNLTTVSINIAEGVPQSHSPNVLLQLLPKAWRIRYLARKTRADTVIPSPTRNHVSSMQDHVLSSTLARNNHDIISAIPISDLHTYTEQSVPQREVIEPVRLQTIVSNEPSHKATNEELNEKTNIESAPIVLEAVHGREAGVGTTLATQDAIISLPSLDTELQVLPASFTPAGSALEAASKLLYIREKIRADGPSFKQIARSTGSKSPWKKFPTYMNFDGHLHLATYPVPGEDKYQNLWRDRWMNPIIDKVRSLDLDQNEIYAIEMCMVGKSPKEANMKPTILIKCDEAVKPVIQNNLGKLIREIVDDDVRFVVIGHRVVLTHKRYIEIWHRISADDHEANTLMGSSARVIVDDGPDSFSSVSTVGGVIMVGEHFYALTTAHSMFTKTKNSPAADFSSAVASGGITDNQTRLFVGEISFYLWAEDEQEQPRLGHSNPTGQAMDWALIKVENDIALPNLIDEKSEMFEVAGVVDNENIGQVREVILLCGISGRQSGIVGRSPTAVMIGKNTFISYTVYLERPLEAGDSGSWVVTATDHRLCGHIFTRVIDEPCAYMLPIQPIFESISQKLDGAEVKVPDAITVRRLRKGKQPERILEEVEHEPQPEHTSYTPNIVASTSRPEQPGIQTSYTSSTNLSSQPPPLDDFEGNSAMQVEPALLPNVDQHPSLNRSYSESDLRIEFIRPSYNYLPFGDIATGRLTDFSVIAHRPGPGSLRTLESERTFINQATRTATLNTVTPRHSTGSIRSARIFRPATEQQPASLRTNIVVRIPTDFVVLMPIIWSAVIIGVIAGILGVWGWLVFWTGTKGFSKAKRVGILIFLPILILLLVPALWLFCFRKRKSWASPPPLRSPPLQYENELPEDGTRDHLGQAYSARDFAYPAYQSNLQTDSNFRVYENG